MAVSLACSQLLRHDERVRQHGLGTSQQAQLVVMARTEMGTQRFLSRNDLHPTLTGETLLRPQEGALMGDLLTVRLWECASQPCILA